MIKIDALTVQFGGITPLDALDAEFVAPICGLIGPNGAGKTTLVNVLSGFVTPVKGDDFFERHTVAGAVAAPPCRHWAPSDLSAGTCRR